MWYAAMAALLVAAQQPPPGPVLSVELPAERLSFPNSVHMAGLPDVGRGAKVEVTLGPEGIEFKFKKKPRARIPLDRIRKVQLFAGGRMNAGQVYAGAVAAGILGAWLLSKNKPVDVLVLEFANERGGLMGVVALFPGAADGPRIKTWLEGRGVTITEPERKPP
jgi:hypothetical protein